jgi:hypothetical protein
VWKGKGRPVITEVMFYSGYPGKIGIKQLIKGASKKFINQ